MGGTPPRVWGKQKEQLPLFEDMRYTPTCVGKTIGGLTALIVFFGTPPRVWGKRNAHPELH